MRGVLLLAILTLTCCATNKSPLASASPVERQFAAAAETWDLNHDGNVTCDEWKQYATKLFQDADSNHDGFLTREEFAAMSRVDRLFETVGFAALDADADGRIALSELIDRPNPAFTLLDRDHDCVLSPEERIHGGDRGTGGGKRGGRHRGGGSGGL
jgi:Ca2+-binding EF-hand superfamily protein